MAVLTRSLSSKRFVACLLVSALPMPRSSSRAHPQLSSKAPQRTPPKKPKRLSKRLVPRSNSSNHDRIFSQGGTRKAGPHDHPGNLSIHKSNPAPTRAPSHLMAFESIPSVRTPILPTEIENHITLPQLLWLRRNLSAEYPTKPWRNVSTSGNLKKSSNPPI